MTASLCRTTPVFKSVSCLILSSFLFQSVFPNPTFAQSIAQLNLPQAGSTIAASEAFTPMMLKGITLDPKNPLQMDFIVNTGDTALQGEALEKEGLQLVKYFLAALTTPEKELWVNLSPYEKNRIIPQTLGETEMGRDMLAQDYVLKQLTSSLMSPDGELGKKFWEEVYGKWYMAYGENQNSQTTDHMPHTNDLMESFNKVWIVPQKAKVYQHGASAFVVESRLKVMLEEDYAAIDQLNIGEHAKTTTPEMKKVIQDVIIPAIEDEVNNGAHFAKLRQIFNALILSYWYKQNLKNTLLSQIYVDQGKTDGVNVDDPAIAQQIYNEYLEAFKKGAYDMIREDYDPATQEMVARKYFSGGTAFDNGQMAKAFEAIPLTALSPADFSGRGNVNLRVGLADGPGFSAAMLTVEQEKVQGREVWDVLHQKVLTNPDVAKAVGVPVGSAISSLTQQGEQGYFAPKGRQFFLNNIQARRQAYEKRKRLNGNKPIKAVVKAGIGGQHTPFQGIADAFAVNNKDVFVDGIYELGMDLEAYFANIVETQNIGWDQISLIISSKSGSTDETMKLGEEALRVVLKHIAMMRGVADGELLANQFFAYLNSINIKGGQEAAELFKDFSLQGLTDFLKQQPSLQNLDLEKVRDILGRVLVNVTFETTNNPQKSRLAAFMQNSGLDKSVEDGGLGEYQPLFIEMFDNTGGRYTGLMLHMEEAIALLGIDASEYYESILERLGLAMGYEESGNYLGNIILDENYQRIAFLIPDELFWLGKSMEQTFNESLWQKGGPRLIAVRESDWEAQKKYYLGQSDAYVIHLPKQDEEKYLYDYQSNGQIAILNPIKLDSDPDRLARHLGATFFDFYNMTYTIGNRLIARTLAEKGLSADQIDLEDPNNPATQTLIDNLFLLQPYVELGKGSVTSFFTQLQAGDARKNLSSAIIDLQREAESFSSKVVAASDVSPTVVVETVSDLSSQEKLNQFIQKGVAHAQETDRLLVPIIYGGGEAYAQLRDDLIAMGVPWVLQGTGDQHINLQQVLALPKNYYLVVISLVDEDAAFQKSNPSVGFAKKELNNIPDALLRHQFAVATFGALTEKRRDQGGEGALLTMPANQMDMLRGAFRSAFGPDIAMIASAPKKAGDEAMLQADLDVMFTSQEIRQFLSDILSNREDGYIGLATPETLAVLESGNPSDIPNRIHNWIQQIVNKNTGLFNVVNVDDQVRTDNTGSLTFRATSVGNPENIDLGAGISTSFEILREENGRMVVEAAVAILWGSDVRVMVSNNQRAVDFILDYDGNLTRVSSKDNRLLKEKTEAPDPTKVETIVSLGGVYYDRPPLIQAFEDLNLNEKDIKGRHSDDHGVDVYLPVKKTYGFVGAWVTWGELLGLNSIVTASQGRVMVQTKNGLQDVSDVIVTADMINSKTEVYVYAGSKDLVDELEVLSRNDEFAVVTRSRQTRAPKTVDILKNPALSDFLEQQLGAWEQNLLSQDFSPEEIASLQESIGNTMEAIQSSYTHPTKIEGISSLDDDQLKTLGARGDFIEALVFIQNKMSENAPRKLRLVYEENGQVFIASGEDIIKQMGVRVGEDITLLLKGSKYERENGDKQIALDFIFNHFNNFIVATNIPGVIIISEEEKRPIYTGDPKNTNGVRLVVLSDPVDGSDLAKTGGVFVSLYQFVALKDGQTIQNMDIRKFGLMEAVIQHGLQPVMAIGVNDQVSKFVLTGKQEDRQFRHHSDVPNILDYELNNFTWNGLVPQKKEGTSLVIALGGSPFATMKNRIYGTLMSTLVKIYGYVSAYTGSMGVDFMKIVLAPAPHAIARGYMYPDPKLRQAFEGTLVGRMMMRLGGDALNAASQMLNFAFSENEDEITGKKTEFFFGSAWEMKLILAFREYVRSANMKMEEIKEQKTAEFIQSYARLTENLIQEVASSSDRWDEKDVRRALLTWYERPGEMTWWELLNSDVEIVNAVLFGAVRSSATKDDLVKPVVDRAMLKTGQAEEPVILDVTKKIALSFKDIPETQLFHGEYEKLYPLTLQFFQLYGGEKSEYQIVKKLANQLETIQIVIDNNTQDGYADVDVAGRKITINRDYLDFLFHTGRKKIYMSFISGLLVNFLEDGDETLKKDLERLLVGQKRSLANDGETRLDDTRRLYDLQRKVEANRNPEQAKNPYFLNEADVTLVISDLLQRGRILDKRRLRDLLKEEYELYGIRDITPEKADELLKAFWEKQGRNEGGIVHQGEEKIKDNIDDLMKKLDPGAKVKGLDIGEADADQLINTYSMQRAYMEDAAYKGRVVVWDIEVERQDEVNFGGKTAHTGEMMYMPHASTLSNFASTGDTFQRVFNENNTDVYLAHLNQVLGALRAYVKTNRRKLNVLPKDLKEDVEIQLKSLRAVVDHKEETTVLVQVEKIIKHMEQVAQDLKGDGYRNLNDYFKDVGAKLDAKVRTLREGEKKAEEELKQIRAELLKNKDKVTLSAEQKTELTALYEQHAELLLQLNEMSMSLTELKGTFKEEEKQAIEDTVKIIETNKKALEQVIIAKEVEIYGDLYQRKKVEWINNFLKDVNRHLQESYNDGAEKLLTASRLMIVPEDVKKAFKSNLVLLAQRIGVPLDQLVLAVRSSAVGEDSETASFAGRQDTYIFVRPIATPDDPDGLENIINSWIFNQSSLFNKRALEYRFDNNLPTYDEHVEISTLFQHMFLSEKSFISFSVVRNTGGFPAVSWQIQEGQGEKLVSGEETGSEFIFTFDGQLLLREKGDRRFKIVEKEGGLAKHEIPLTDDEKRGFAMPDIIPLQQASGLIAYMHRFYGGNVDTEGAFRTKRDANNRPLTMTGASGALLDILGNPRLDWSFVFTQSRPETVESRKDKDIIPLKRIVVTPEAFKKAQDLNQVLPYNFVASTGGTAQGPIAWVLDKSPETLSKTKDMIMATYQSDPDMNTAMIKARGIFAIRGGQNSHTMIVASEYGLVAITGIPDVTLEELQRALMEGTLVTIDAERKKIIIGIDHELAMEGKDFNIRLLPDITPGDTKMGTITASPTTAFKQWALRNYPDYSGIGLTRLELALVDKIGFHPMVLWAYENMQKKERNEPVEASAPVLRKSERFAPDVLRRYQNTRAHQKAQADKEEFEGKKAELDVRKSLEEAERIQLQLLKVRIAKKEKEMREIEQKGLLNLENEAEIYELLLKFDRMKEAKEGEKSTEPTLNPKDDHVLIEEIEDAYLVQKVEQAIGGYKSAQDFYISVLSETMQAIGETLVPDKNEVVTVLQKIADSDLRLKVWDIIDHYYEIGLGYEEPLNELKKLLNTLDGGDIQSIQKGSDADVLWDVIGLVDKRMYIRTDDLKSDEYENMPGSEKYVKTETNAMRGWRGVGMELDMPELFKNWHLASIKKVVDTKRFKIGVFFPIVRRPTEVYKAFKMMREVGLEGEVSIGIMTELETNAINAEEFTVVGMVEENDLNDLVEKPADIIQQLKQQRYIRKNGLFAKRFKDILLNDRFDEFVLEGYDEIASENTESNKRIIFDYLKSLIIFVDFTSTGGNDLRQGMGDDRNGGNPRLEVLISDTSTSVLRANALIFKGVDVTNKKYGRKIKKGFCGNAPSVDKQYAKGLKHLGADTVSVVIGSYAGSTDNLVDPELPLSQGFIDAKAFEFEIDPNARDHIQTFDAENSVDIDQFRFQLGDDEMKIHYQMLKEYDSLVARKDTLSDQENELRRHIKYRLSKMGYTKGLDDPGIGMRVYKEKLEWYLGERVKQGQRFVIGTDRGYSYQYIKLDHGDRYEPVEANSEYGMFGLVKALPGLILPSKIKPVFYEKSTDQVVVNKWQDIGNAVWNSLIETGWILAINDEDYMINMDADLNAPMNAAVQALVAEEDGDSADVKSEKAAIRAKIELVKAYLRRMMPVDYDFLKTELQVIDGLRKKGFDVVLKLDVVRSYKEVDQVNKVLEQLGITDLPIWVDAEFAGVLLENDLILDPKRNVQGVTISHPWQMVSNTIGNELNNPNGANITQDDMDFEMEKILQVLSTAAKKRDIPFYVSPEVDVEEALAYADAAMMSFLSWSNKGAGDPKKEVLDHLTETPMGDRGFYVLPTHSPEVERAVIAMGGQLEQEQPYDPANQAYGAKIYGFPDGIKSDVVLPSNQAMMAEAGSADRVELENGYYRLDFTNGNSIVYNPLGVEVLQGETTEVIAEQVYAPSIDRQLVVEDNAELGEEVGGIDLNPTLFESFDIQKDDAGMMTEINGTPISEIRANINGLHPFIINIRPLTDGAMLQLLGMNDAQDESLPSAQMDADQKFLAVQKQS